MSTPFDATLNFMEKSKEFIYNIVNTKNIMLKFDQIESNKFLVSEHKRRLSKLFKENDPNWQSPESPDVSGEASNRGNGNPKVIVEMTGKYMNPVNTQ